MRCARAAPALNARADAHSPVALPHAPANELPRTSHSSSLLFVVRALFTSRRYGLACQAALIAAEHGRTVGKLLVQAAEAGADVGEDVLAAAKEAEEFATPIAKDALVATAAALSAVAAALSDADLSALHYAIACAFLFCARLRIGALRLSRVPPCVRPRGGLVYVVFCEVPILSSLRSPPSLTLPRPLHLHRSTSPLPPGRCRPTRVNNAALAGCGVAGAATLYEASCAVVEAAIGAGRAVARAAAAVDYGPLADAAGGAAKLAVAAAAHSANAAKTFGSLVAPGT